MKRLIIVLVTVLFAAGVVTTFIVCNNSRGEAKTTLDTPLNVEMSENGLITWNMVKNAQGYVVTLNGAEYRTTETSYQVATDLLSNDIKYSVYAVADGYENSPKSPELTFVGKGNNPILPTVSVTMSKTSEIKSGKTATLKAYIDSVEATSDIITWAITEGESYATITEDGVITANEVDSDKRIKVVATSKENPDCKAEREIWILAKTNLTQEMLNLLQKQKIGFEGYDKIDLFRTDMFGTYYRTATMPIRTAMDGDNWYAEYENSDTGLKTGIYYTKRTIDEKEIASQVSVNFNNEEQYVPMLAEDQNSYVTWEEAGLYNALTALSVNDFEFDETLWKWIYKGDVAVSKRLISSCTPYDFEIDKWGLLIDEGEIVGIYAKSKDDYQIAEGFKAIQELYLAVDASDNVQVPTISKFTHEAEYDELYNTLQTAIDNMRELENYTLDYSQTTSSQYGTTYSGYVETITKDLCYFAPYNIVYDNKQNEVRNPQEGAEYGFKKIDDNLYNSFMTIGTDDDDKPTYAATRAYNKSFKNAKPSFMFSSEIFNAYYIDEEAGTTTYYVNELMCGVASTFYYGVGNDSNLYGIFATKALTGATDFTPYVVVKDGYIVQTGFYFYLGSMLGITSINYSDFNTATIPDGVDVTFEKRDVPTSWDQLTINAHKEGSTTTADDIEKSAPECLKAFFGDSIADEDGIIKLPFFGDVLGDSYGFGLETTKIPGGTKVNQNAIVFYYDVPLDIDYTITSSLMAVKDQLIKAGFTKNRYDEYYKAYDDENYIYVAPVDSSLDFMIYVWKTPIPETDQTQSI